MNNYEFCAQWVADQDPCQNARILDYGCGAGEIVQALRQRGFEAFGCDVFYEGGDYSGTVESRLVEGGIVRRMDGGAIPFESASFDYVINNQVMEHVESLDDVLAEIQRVLKPAGAVLSVFPHKGVWREGHSGIAFLHRFAKDSRARVYYAAGLRMLGLGHHKGTKSAMQWSRDFCEWLDKWTHYRSQREIHAAYGRYFSGVRHIEDDWLQRRLGARGRWIAWLPRSVRVLAVHKLAGVVFVARKAG